MFHTQQVLPSGLAPRHCSCCLGDQEGSGVKPGTPSCRTGTPALRVLFLAWTYILQLYSRIHYSIDYHVPPLFPFSLRMSGENRIENWKVEAIRLEWHREAISSGLTELTFFQSQASVYGRQMTIQRPFHWKRSARQPPSSHPPISG